MIHVIAILTAKPGQRDTVLGIFRANIPAVRAEEGCIEYGTAIDTPELGTAHFGPDSFVVIEKWASPEALAAHAVAPHMLAYAERTRDLMAGRTVHVLTPVD